MCFWIVYMFHITSVFCGCNVNIIVSENYYNPDNLDLTCFSAQSACDIGLVGMDNGLVTSLVGQTITFTNGLFNQTEKFMHTVTSNY